MNRYGIKFKWETGYEDIISGEKSREMGIQVFDDFYIKYSKIEEFIEYLETVTNSEHFIHPLWDGVTVKEIDKKCHYCGGGNENMRIYGKGNRVLCDSCIEKSIGKIREIISQVLFYDESGIFIKRIPETSTYPPYIDSGEISICIGRSHYISNIVFCNEINFIYLINRLEDEMNNVGNHGNHICHSCLEKTEGDSVRVDIKEFNMKRVQMQTCPIFHEDCLRKILEKLEIFIEEHEQEIIAKNI